MHRGDAALRKGRSRGLRKSVQPGTAVNMVGIGIAGRQQHVAIAFERHRVAAGIRLGKKHLRVQRGGHVQRG